MKVFLSSTYKDLIDYRAAAIRAVEGTNYQASKMEVFGARSEEPVEACLKEVEQSDLFIGIYALRYGFIPEDSDISITEMEYVHAKKLGKPIYCFILDEEHQPWLQKWVEDEPGKSKLKDFKQWVQKIHVCDYFTTPNDLRAKVANALSHYVANHLPADESSSLGRGEVRGSTLPTQPYFFGREKELEIIAEALSPESRTWGALIDGPGGIGKTALAVRAAYLASERLFERKIFISAKVRELTPEGEKPLKDFARADYLSMINELALELGDDNIPRLPPEERSNALRLALSGKKALIIFDNLETLLEDERSRLFQILGRLPEGNKAIVTSRRRADIDARAVRLDRLQVNEAMLLIGELAKNNSTLARTSIRERHNLYEITNGNPLFIRWLVGQLGREGSQCRTIPDAYAFIDKAPKGNDPLEYIFGDLLETFSEHETSVLASLTHFTSPAKLIWIAEMTGLAEKACETSLEDLADRSILISNSEAREYFLPPLAAHFIRTRRTESVQQTGDKLANRIFAISLQHGGDNANFEDFQLLDSEWSSFIAAIPNLINGENNRLQSFASAVFQFFNFSGKWDELIDLNQQAENKALLAGDMVNAGWRAYQTGWVYFLRGQAFKVLTCASRAENHWKSAGIREKSMAIRLSGIGHELNHDYKAAIASYKEVLQLRRTVNPISDDVAIALNDLASAERQMGDYTAAEQHYQEAHQIDRRNNSKEGLAIYLSNLSVLALDRKQWIEAERLARNALEEGEKLGRQELIANNCSHIAKAAFYQDRPTEAKSYALRAIDIYSQLRSPGLKEAQETLAQCESLIEKEKMQREIERKRKSQS